MITIYRRLVTPIDRGTPPALLVLRAVLGVLFIDHGVSKFRQNGGIAGFEYFLRSLHNIPAPALTSHVVPVLEIVGGALLVLGLVTRVVAAVLALEMVGTGLLVKAHDLHVGVVSSAGAGVELDLVYLVALLMLVVLGPGLLSADAVLRLDGQAIRDVEPATPQGSLASR